MDDWNDWIEDNPIRAQRKKREWSQAKLAAVCNVSYKTVAHWEDGSQVPGDENVQALVFVFGEGIESDLKKWMQKKP